MGEKSTPPNSPYSRPDRHDFDRNETLVIEIINCLRRSKFSKLTVSEGGDINLRLMTGEVFHFREKAVTRVA
jgi:hypothetical protein